uniref:Uncharacterized protein n=1 Tax=Rhipicephalus zambeziensis TaxID=60191 RepID=A0A224Y9P9_9ACAR
MYETMALANFGLGISLIFLATTAPAIKIRKIPRIYGSLCNTTTQCNIGQKLACLVLKTGKLIQCIPHMESCEYYWLYYCKRPYIPRCKNEPTECKCCCGRKDGWISRILRMCF